MNATQLASELDSRIERQLGDHPCSGDVYVFLGLLYIARAILATAQFIAECLPNAGRGI